MKEKNKNLDGAADKIAETKVTPAKKAAVKNPNPLEAKSNPEEIEKKGAAEKAELEKLRLKIKEFEKNEEGEKKTPSHSLRNGLVAITAVFLLAFGVHKYAESEKNTAVKTVVEADALAAEVEADALAAEVEANALAAEVEANALAAAAKADSLAEELATATAARLLAEQSLSAKAKVAAAEVARLAKLHTPPPFLERVWNSEIGFKRSRNGECLIVMVGDKPLTINRRLNEDGSRSKEYEKLPTAAVQNILSRSPQFSGADITLILHNDVQKMGIIDRAPLWHAFVVVTPAKGKRFPTARTVKK